MMLRLAIVGWPVEHSLSPRLWQGVAGGRGIELTYERCPVAPGDDAAWEAVWTGPWTAFNVTAPYKERAAARCDRLSTAAKRIQSVNTVVREGHAWVGWTTDGYGVVRALEAAGLDPTGRRIAVLGTGGAGRAAARAAADREADVVLVSRHPEAVPVGCETLRRLGWEGLVGEGPFDAIVNATPLGRDAGDPPPPIPYDEWCDGAVALDLNYASPTTAFLTAAEAAGARIRGGAEVLIYQATRGAAIVLDEDPSRAVEYEEAFRAEARAAGFAVS